jgi:hypothetical protein
MRISNTMLAIIFLGLLTSGTLTPVQAAPLQTNIATMKSMLSSDVVQARWGGWRSGWGYAAGVIAAGGSEPQQQARSSAAPSQAAPIMVGIRIMAAHMVRTIAHPPNGYGGYSSAYYGYPYGRYYYGW